MVLKCLKKEVPFEILRASKVLSSILLAKSQNVCPILIENKQKVKLGS